jgi:hypothetical protein
MSTGDVATDPMVAKAPGTGNPIPAAYAAGLGRLASIYLQQGGSATNTPLSAKQAAPVSPDIIELGGNMTSTDQYVVSVIQPSGGSCGGQRILLDPQSPSMLRILGSSADPVDELNNIFQPTAPGLSPPPEFMMRLVDKTGRSQFVGICPGTPTGGVPLQPFVDVDPLTPILMASATGTVGGLNGYGSGSLVNPVQIVHWEILPANLEPAQYQQSLGGQPLTPTVVDPTKYDLVRGYVDAKSGQVIAGTLEVVAEYAVDLEFAFSVDTGANNLQPNIVTFAFDNPANAPWATNIVTSAPAVGVGPQRIRSVRVRLATRTSEPDRTLDVAVPNATGPFMYRYCLIANGCDPQNLAGVLQYARARTVTAEVSLPNQSRNYL